MKIIFNSKLLQHNLHKTGVESAGAGLYNESATATAIVTAIVTLTKEKPISAQPNCILTLQGQKEQEPLELPTAVYVYTHTLTAPWGCSGPQVSLASARQEMETPF